MNDTALFSYDASLRLKEQYAEHLALGVVGTTSFTDCLRRFGLSPALEIALPTGGSIRIEGGGLCNQRTWKKFLSTTSQEEHVCQLTGVGELLARHYTAWLLTQHTRRYRLIQSEEHLAWFEQVVRLAVIHHIMHSKYACYRATGQETFADPWVASEMASLLLRKELLRESARLIHHIVRTPTEAQHLIEQLYDLHTSRIQERPLMHREPLPALPQGVTPAFADLVARERTDDE